MNNILTLETNKHKIKLDNFEGPLDLLCHLIDVNKMNIYDIRIDEITDQYIEFLDEQTLYDLDIASEFLIMVSTLLYLKSKNLLPKIEENENEPTEEELIRRIVEYKKFKDASLGFRERYEENKKRFFGIPMKIDLPKQKIEKKYEILQLANRYKEILERNEPKTTQNEIDLRHIAISERITVTSKVKEIFKELYKKSRFVFGEIFHRKKCSKIEIVTAFTGLLELSRRNKIMTTQKEIFGDIIVEKSKV